MDNKKEELTIQQKLNQYIGQGFNDAQIEEIRIGLEDELDVSFYARQDMPANEMMYLRKELYKRHLDEKARDEEQQRLQKDKEDELTAIKTMEKIKARRELAIMSLILFAVSVIGFFIFVTNIL